MRFSSLQSATNKSVSDWIERKSTLGLKSPTPRAAIEQQETPQNDSETYTENGKRNRQKISLLKTTIIWLKDHC